MTRFLASSVFAALATLGLAALAQDVKVEQVVGGLSNPCGVAVQPGTGALYLTDSANGRVCRVDIAQRRPQVLDELGVYKAEVGDAKRFIEHRRLGEQS